MSVWVLNPDASNEQIWLPGTVVEKTPRDCHFELKVEVSGGGGGSATAELVFRSDDAGEVTEVKRRNDDTLGLVPDLILLPHLHEPAILHALVARFDACQIYTYTGPILIAVNPFQRLELYTEEILESYYTAGIMQSQGIETAEPMPPHVYAIAANAYQDMMLRLRAAAMRGGAGRAAGRGGDDVDGGGSSQSILISGESGAGKTVSTKVCLEYLTTVGRSTTDLGGGNAAGGGEKSVTMQRVLQSNPILEAFGNARTLRNDNSSRFGKLMEMFFSTRGELLGGRIVTYLLEKVRLPSHQTGERNFHIFYQLCAGASENEKRDWFGTSSGDGAVDVEPENFAYANQGGVFQLRGVDDGEELQRVKKAMAVLNFADDHATSALGVAAALLQLGECQFVDHTTVDGDGSRLLGMSDDDAASAAGTAAKASAAAAKGFCGLLGLELERWADTMTTKTVRTRFETVRRLLRPDDALDARDALAKAVYSRLFDLLVSTINKSLVVDDSEPGAQRVAASVNVLDIFGFECFKENSFEQLCINFANEKLQQQFNQFVFKMEQAEYEREAITWSFIEFPDNQDCLDLIEGRKPPGLLAMLDDECTNLSGTDRNFAQRIYKAFNEQGKKHARFEATRLMVPRGQFRVIHYAGPVTYVTDRFRDKNRDELSPEAVELVMQSSFAFTRALFSDDATALNEAAKAASGSSGGGGARAQKKLTSK